ncbi:hypothetical protein [Roseibium sp. RKSG952]|uniref:hypothetical protein n=1 Tax=Roseibium sp. RKSG952 TaxID=2529384 RepID=UPI0012BCAAA2|nr:hypothetical protein [Roseibium sp. RKSG952]MTH96145.1 hypothetical protein [Roseibium sp. RKSG952]
MNDNLPAINEGFRARDVFALAWRDLEGEFGSALWFVVKPFAFLVVFCLVAYSMMAYAIGTLSFFLALVVLVLGMVASTLEMKKKILGIPRERSLLASVTTFEFWIYTFVAMGATMTYFAAGAAPISVITSLAGVAFQSFSDAVVTTDASTVAGEGVRGGFADHAALETFAMGLAVIVFAMFLGVIAGFVAWARLGLITTFVVDGRVPSYKATWKMLSGHTWVVFRVLVLCNLLPFLVTAVLRTLATFTDIGVLGKVGIGLVIVLVFVAQSILSSAAVARIYLIVKDSRNSLLPAKRGAYMSKYGPLTSFRP